MSVVSKTASFDVADWGSIGSGVGTRDYYRKLGYELDGPYMSKMLASPDEMS